MPSRTPLCTPLSRVGVRWPTSLLMLDTRSVVWPGPPRAWLSAPSPDSAGWISPEGSARLEELRPDAAPLSAARGSGVAVGSEPVRITSRLPGGLMERVGGEAAESARPWDAGRVRRQL